jgi:DNA polymerase-3 subunit chi
VTQVDFYILKSDSDDARLKLACRIAEKAMQLDHHVYIHAESPAQGKQLDELLWTFSQGSFVPHRLLEQPCRETLSEPVLIGCKTAPEHEPWDLLLNLDGEVPEFFSRYARVAEVVDAQAQRRDLGRRRYRYYRDRGYELNTHRM